MSKRAPDRLDIEASMATAAGMSYGKFKALQLEFRMTPPDNQAITDIAPKKYLTCTVCGTPMPTKGCRRKYCSSGCADVAYQEQLRLHSAKRRKKK